MLLMFFDVVTMFTQWPNGCEGALPLLVVRDATLGRRFRCWPSLRQHACTPRYIVYIVYGQWIQCLFPSLVGICECNDKTMLDVGASAAGALHVCISRLGSIGRAEHIDE